MIFERKARARFAPVLDRKREAEKAIDIGLVRRAEARADARGHDAAFEAAEHCLLAVEPAGQREIGFVQSGEVFA